METTTPDLSGLLAIHRQMRIDTSRLVQAIETATPADRDGRLAPLARWARGFTHELHLHHTIEDNVVFPAVTSRIPRTAAVLDGLEADHTAVAALLERLPQATHRLADRSVSFASARSEAMDVATELRDLLHPHLDTEDDEILPAIVQHFTADEYDAIHEAAIKTMPKKGLGFSIPWNVQALDPEARAEALATAPPALRLLYRVTRRRFSRLCEAAFPAVQVSDRAGA